MIILIEQNNPIHSNILGVITFSYIHKNKNEETKSTNLSPCMHWTVILLLLFFICLFVDRCFARQSLMKRKHSRLTLLYLDQRSIISLIY